MACINPNSPEFKAALERTGNPLLAEIEVDKSQQQPSVKPGVEELFSSTPELAQSVYEALGIYNVWHSSDKKIDKFISENVEGYFTKVKKGSPKAVFFTANKPPQESFLSKREYQEQFAVKMGNPLVVDTKTGYSRDNESFKELVDRALNNNHDGVIIKNVDDNGFVGDVYISLNAEKISRITPEQKQQALQLYSQYLDTIFPDSVVKDIVYHGTSRSEKSFEKRVPLDAYGSNAIYFANESYAKTFGNLIPALLDIRNPFTSELKFMRRRLKPGWTSPSGTVDARALLNTKKNNDGLIGVDYSEQENNTYVVRESEQIHILGNKQDIEGFKQFVGKQQAPSESMFQLGGAGVSSKASPKTIAIIKDFLKRIGVEYTEVKGVVVNGKMMDANAVANITQSLIQIVEGKTDVALPEEAMHFAVEIIQQTNPKLFNQLLKEINQYDALKQVFADYGTNPYYQKDGKPDVIKLKKEAIGKVLAETVIEKSEGFTEKPELLQKTRTWWQQIYDFLKGLFSRSGFDTAAMKIISGEEIGNVEDIRSEENNLYLSDTSRDVLFNRLKDMSNRLVKDEDNPDEKKRGYYINGVRIGRRVTELVDDWYQRRFRDKQLTKSEHQKAVDDLKAEKGTLGHKDFEYAFKLFVGDDGFLRETPLSDEEHKSFMNPEDRSIYETLRDNLKQRLHSFGKGTRFLSEVMVYDQKRNIAGTIDFVAIQEDGKVNILDWKFMDLNIDKYEDVPWYKVNAWRIQMGQYKYILENAYGVKNKDFGQTRMIPIKVVYSQGNAKLKILPKLLKIMIGDVDISMINEDFLIPVGLEEESTGNDEIDELIKKLNGLYDKISEQKVTPAQKQEKARQLNALFSAIRQLQMKKSVAPLVYQAKLLNEYMRKIIKEYEDDWKNTPADEKNDDVITDFYRRFDTLATSASKIYFNLDTDLSFLFEDKELSEEDAAIWDDLKKVGYETRRLLNNAQKTEADFVQKFVVGREGVEENIMNPEKVIKGVTRSFVSTSILQTTAISTLFKKSNRVLGYAAMDINDETRRLMEIKNEYDKWARKNNLSIKNYFWLIKKKGRNELIDQFEKEFYVKLKEAIQDKNFEWIRENVDSGLLEEEMKKQLEKEIERINDQPEITEEDTKRKKREIENAKALYSISGPESVGWLMYDVVKKFPLKSMWETDIWQLLTKKDNSGNYINKPALDFYNYIVERNNYYQSIGYINSKEARVFLPYVAKGLMEKFVMGGKVTLGEQFLRAISVDEGEIGYGKKDPVTGESVESIPIYLTKEIDAEVSEDLFRTMALYNEMAIKYKYLSDIEYQARALLNIERKKKSIATSMFSKTIYDEDNDKLVYDPRNDENSKLLEAMIKAIVYQQKYIQSESFDQILTRIGSFGKKANKILGMQLFPENLEGRQISINKVLDQLNNQFQLTALGLNPFSAISNRFGGSFQSIINSGKYFTRSEYIAEEMGMWVGKMVRKDQDKLFAALEYFLPLTENYNKELAKTLSLSKLTQENVQEFLMILMRKTDKAVQTMNFFAFLKNTIVQDGRVVNSREYLRSLPEYADMYAGTESERKERMEKFEEDVKKLNEEKGLIKLSTLDDKGRLVIPGVERKSESVIDVRRKVQSLNKDALGNLSEDDLRLINLTILGKSFMIFKNWIPRPIDVRMGNIKYNSGSDAYEWGRMRMVFRMLSWNLWQSLTNMINASKANDEGVEYMRELWEKKREEYKRDTGKELKMTQSQFMDLVRHNLKAQVVDLVFLLTLMALVAGLKAFAPDEEEEEDESVRNAYKLLARAADKVRDELLYFYDPTSLMKTISSGIFPSISYLENFRKFLFNFMKENYAIILGDEVTEDKNYVIKYLMKSFPITNQSLGMLPTLYPELAKDLGVRATTEARPVGF